MTSTRARCTAALYALAGWPRWLAAGLCLIAAAVAALGSATRSGPPPSSTIVVAARDLPAGHLLVPADLRMVRWPDSALPRDPMPSQAGAIGQRTAQQLFRGEPMSSAALLDPAVVSALAAGQVAASVTLAGRDQGALVHRGAVIDLYPASDQGLVGGSPLPATGHAIAEHVRVLAVLPDSAPPADGTGQSAGLTVLIATDRQTAGRLAAHLATTFLATLVPPT